MWHVWSWPLSADYWPDSNFQKFPVFFSFFFLFWCNLDQLLHSPERIRESLFLPLNWASAFILSWTVAWKASKTKVHECNHVVCRFLLNICNALRWIFCLSLPQDKLFGTGSEAWGRGQEERTKLGVDQYKLCIKQTKAWTSEPWVWHLYCALEKQMALEQNLWPRLQSSCINSAGGGEGNRKKTFLFSICDSLPQTALCWSSQAISGNNRT